MVEVERITAKEAREKVSSGRALLICAYESPETYATMNLEGSISIQEFRKRRSSLPRDTELIFYCA
jgi:hypothetical protein